MGKKRRFTNPFYKKKMSDEQLDGPRVHLTCSQCEILHVICDIKDDYFCPCGEKLVELDQEYKSAFLKGKNLEFDDVM